MLKKLNELLTEMEKIVGLHEDKDFYSVDDEERLGELYYEFKEEKEHVEEYHLSGGIETPSYLHHFDEVQKLQARFECVCAEFETPEDIEDMIWGDMFPEGDDEGFDYTFEEK